MNATEVDAMALAEFSYLVPERVDEFKNNIGKGFLPDEFWRDTALGFAPRDKKLAWQQAQQLLCRAWEKQFPLEETGLLIAFILFYSGLHTDVVPDYLTEVSGTEGGENVPSQGPNGLEVLALIPPNLERVPKFWPFQRAVMFFAMNPNRAAFCLRCGRRFFKIDKSTKYCPYGNCAQQARQESKREWWDLHGSSWRKTGARKAAKKGRSK